MWGCDPCGQLRELALQSGPSCRVQFTPTIDHCSLATLIGLCIRTQLMRKLPKTYKLDISVCHHAHLLLPTPILVPNIRAERADTSVLLQITEGGHASEDQVNKQLNDKERVAAALENTHLLSMVDKCLATTEPQLTKNI